MKNRENLTSNAVTSLTGILLNGIRCGHEDILRSGARRVTRPDFERMIRSEILALRERQVLVGTRVAIHGRASPSLIAALIACFLEGAIAIPVDEDLSLARKLAIIEASSPALTLDFSNGKIGIESRLTVPRADEPNIHGSSGLDAIDLPNVPEDAPCYIFFTSGTTGTPKGILGRRGGLAHFLQWEAEMLGISAGDRVSALTRLSFDVVLRDILLPIVGGATGCIPDGTLSLGVRDVLPWIAEMGITVTHAVPSLSQAYVANLPAGYKNTTLRHTLFAGEPLSSALVGKWRNAFPNTVIHNLYGPTETTLAKFWWCVPDPAPEGIQCCGHALPGTNVLILDNDRQEVRQGETGEVAIQTPHQSLGYLDAMEESAKNFTTIHGRPTYLTGDLGHIDNEGKLHLRGRRDHQVKILGVRVEPAGVAAVLQSHEDVDEAAVVYVAASDGDGKLIAYFTAKKDPISVQRKLRTFMAERLPSAAVPAQFVALDALPITSNGKLDRSRLSLPTETDEMDDPRDDLERAVSSAMAEALRRDHVGVNDDFFSLGGDSLAATLVCFALEERIGVHVQPSIFLHAPTAREMASRIRGDATPPLQMIPKAERTRYFHLTPQQRRYFRTFFTGGGKSWCNMVAIFDLPEEVTAFEVHRALTEIALRHDSLRLVFSYDDAGNVVQTIDPSPSFRLGTLDLGHMQDVDVLARIDHLRAAEGEQEIALFENAPLFRATLLMLPEGRRKLLWTVHHLISDGSSQEILGNELMSYLSGIPCQYSEVPSFRDIAAWATKGRGNLDSARAYFRQLFQPRYKHAYIEQAVVCDDPQRCHAFESHLESGLRAKIALVARTLKCTPYVLHMAAYFRTVALLSKRDDIVILTPLAGRAHPQLKSVIGDFINLVPIRVENLERLSSGSLVETLKDRIRQTVQHQDYQFDEILDDIDVQVHHDRNPLTGFSLNYMPKSGEGVSAPERHLDRGYKLKYDLLLLIRDFSNVTNLEFQYRAGLFLPRDIGEAHKLFIDNLIGLADDL